MQALMQALERSRELEVRCNSEQAALLDPREVNARCEEVAGEKLPWDLLHPLMEDWVVNDYYAHSPNPHAVRIRESISPERRARLGARASRDALLAAVAASQPSPAAP